MAFGKNKQINPDGEEFPTPSGENKRKITKFPGKTFVLISLGK